MAVEQIDGGYYDEVSHGYYGPDGKWLPSATQVLGLVGFSSYLNVPQETLERKRAIGSLVHELCANIDRYGDVDPSWIPEECLPYVTAYQAFRRDKNFVPDMEWVERPIIACIHGMKVGVTADAIGKLGKHDAVLERKCVAAPKPAWAVQTALQEMARFSTGCVGRTQRFALQLLENGKYKLDPHPDGVLDGFRAISALAVVYARLDSGEKLWELV